MALFPLSDLLRGATVEEFKTTAYGILQSLGFPVSSWQSGARIRTVVILFCRMLAPFGDLIVLITAGGFLDYATGLWLKVLADQVYNVQYRPASFASGAVTLNNALGGLYTYTADTFEVFNPTTKKVYRNIAAFTLNPLQTGLVVPFRAVEVGSASSSSAGSITGIQASLNGVTCSNAADVVGDDEESEPEIRARCRAKVAALSPNGPPSIYEFVAKSLDLNGGVVVTRCNVVADSATGFVTVYCAGPSGGIASPAETSLVQAAFDTWAEPLCITSTAGAAGNVVIDVSATLYVSGPASLTVGDYQALGQAKLSAWFPTLPVGGHNIGAGGRVFLNRIEGELQKSSEYILQVVVSSPASDVVIAPNEVPILGTVTINVVGVA